MFSLFYRSTEKSVASERILTEDRFKKSALIPGALNSIVLNGCVNLLQKVKEPVKQNRHVCKSKLQQLLVYSLSKSNFLLLKEKVSTRVTECISTTPIYK